MNFIIFTDLDGTLLNHGDYSFDDAAPALRKIRDKGIPLIFTTSKTRLEVERLQATMQIQQPFIVENGAAVFFPDGCKGLRVDAGFRQRPYTVVQLGASYGEIRRFIYSVRERFTIRGFGDMTPGEVAELTGLPPEQAAFAKRREFTEPFLLEDISEFEALERTAEAKGFKITRGGRFFHLIGIRQDKGQAARITAAIYARNSEGRVVSIGLGDSANDIPLLQSVDIPVLIPRPSGQHLKLTLPNLRKAAHPGSRGWNDVILQLLDPEKGASSTSSTKKIQRRTGN
jgi:mannosyl-3-phosphoglycerate phosphatase